MSLAGTFDLSINDDNDKVPVTFECVSTKSVNVYVARLVASSYVPVAIISPLLSAISGTKY